MTVKLELDDDQAEALERVLRDAGGSTVAAIGADTFRSLIEELTEAMCSRDEAAYERQQEHLMETGGGPTLREQQIAAMKFK